jgi:excinuclease ABC subunit B
MFKLESKYEPSGDQPTAIKELVDGFLDGKKEQVLLGATGTGKTFTVANVIQQLGKKTLVLAHNKTLAAQLYNEFKSFFPEARVEYFVSYFDYYQPEAYMPGSDTYIEKDSSVNEEINRMRHSATASAVESQDVIIISSVSCIYGLGSPVDYQNLALSLRVNKRISQKDVIYKLIDLQYERNDTNFARSKFRVRGDIVDVVSAASEKEAYRIEFFGDEIDSISLFDILTGKKIKALKHVVLFPASHYAADPEKIDEIISQIKEDAKIEVEAFTKTNKLIEAQRLEQRTNYDLEMMQELGYCSGIENYTRYFTGKKEGESPFTLLDYFGDDWLLVVDESHVTLPQVRGMYEGDRRRKVNLVEYGFRLHAALDNRPLKFEEFHEKISKALYISATPGSYELERTAGVFAEQIIRPTNLIDPEIEIRKKDNQIDDIISEIKSVIPNKVLITTLTKKMAEDLTTYLKDFGIKAVYLHSDIGTIERVQIINSLRKDKFDVLIGINLLREGLDIPEVTRVMILDADKPGFLRSSTALIQTIGRAARNANGRVILYADGMSDAMELAISETKRRRDKQIQYNLDNGLQPITITKDVTGDLYDEDKLDNIINAKKNKKEKKHVITELKKEMEVAVAELNFEKAAELRDLIFELEI